MVHQLLCQPVRISLPPRNITVASTEMKMRRPCVQRSHFLTKANFNARSSAMP